jgi:hypothetical protein
VPARGTSEFTHRDIGRSSASESRNLKSQVSPAVLTTWTACRTIAPRLARATVWHLADIVVSNRDSAVLCSSCSTYDEAKIATHRAACLPEQKQKPVKLCGHAAKLRSSTFERRKAVMCKWPAMPAVDPEPRCAYEPGVSSPGERSSRFEL